MPIHRAPPNFKGDKMNNKKSSYNAFIRSTSNVCSTTNYYQVNLPPHIWKNMGWKINEKVRIKLVKGKEVQNYLMIEKEEE